MSDLRQRQLLYLQQVLESEEWVGDGPFTERCAQQLRDILGIAHAFLTTSATAALEMSAILADLKPDDEVIMPSFAFSSCANAIVLRGATPVFVDVRPDTLNIDDGQLEQARTTRTKAVMMLHYAGVCCEVDSILAFARRHGLFVIEDAAQAFLSTYNGRMAGTLGDVAALSFHGTKNVRCGEGGAFLTSSGENSERAAVIREKGTDRSKFRKGLVDKYTWVDAGSSYLPSEFQAAVLLAELEQAHAITASRVALWNLYHQGLASLEARGVLERPSVPEHCAHNGHIYHVRVQDEQHRDRLLGYLRGKGLGAAFHFLPLHLSEAGARFGRAADGLRVTRSASARLLRLPLSSSTTAADVELTIQAVNNWFHI